MSFVKNRRREGRATSGELFPLTVGLLATALQRRSQAITKTKSGANWPELS
jgi:hypothetical protein